MPRWQIAVLLLLGLVCGMLVSQPLQQFIAWLWPDLSGGSPQRLRIRGKFIHLPNREEPIVLRGFDLMFKYGTPDMDEVTRQDRLLASLVPGVTLARLILNHWDDDVTMATGTDCYDAAAPDFLSPACLDMFDQVVDWATGEVGAWAILTARRRWCGH